MKESEMISAISKYCQDSDGKSFIGNDCAYLQDLGLLISQDSLVENIHFLRDKITPYQLGWKSCIVNLSDIYAGGGVAKYITISISLPKNLYKTKSYNNFIDEFYRGVNDACKVQEKFGFEKVKIIGGDITGSEKDIFISITAIGKIDSNLKASSRGKAKVGYKVILSGEVGTSDAGLKLILNEEKYNTSNIKDTIVDKELFIKYHLEPQIDIEFSQAISSVANQYNFEYAMMDCSDGLMDCLGKIATASDVLIQLDCQNDFEKIPFNQKIQQFKNWQEMILFGGEDYKLIACIPDFVCNILKDKNVSFFEIGNVVEKQNKNECVKILLDENTKCLSMEDIENKCFKHF